MRTKNVLNFIDFSNYIQINLFELIYFIGKSVAKVVDDDIPLVAAASDKQRSRIQIKKGPNGQEYEYEYVYYYYDDDDEPKDKVSTILIILAKIAL